MGDFPLLKHQDNLSTHLLGCCCNQAFHALAKVTLEDDKISVIELQLLEQPQVPPSKLVLDSRYLLLSSEG